MPCCIIVADGSAVVFQQPVRGAQEPNEVILLFEAKDLNRAKTFAESADLRETMQKVGVVDKPDIYFVND
jgi:hypothetical protein